MDFIDLVQKRYSVRAYKPDPVEDDKLAKILEAARLAPTASNRQPFQLIVIHTAGRTAELGRMYSRPWFVQAPIIIAACTNPAEGWKRAMDGVNYSIVDVAIAFDHLTLEATDLGLGTCWIGAFNTQAVCEILGLPPEVDPIALTPLGFPDDSPRAKTRKPLSQLIRYEKW